MSGASDLQLFEELVNNANSLFLSDADYVVINGVTKPTLKKIYADFMASTGTYPSIEEGLLETNGSGTQNRFFTVPGAGGTYETRYRNDGGVAVQVGRVSSADLVDALTYLVKSFDAASSEVEIAVISDQEGGVHMRLTDKRLTAPSFEVSSIPGAVAISDAEGATPFYSDENIPPLSPEARQRPAPPWCSPTCSHGLTSERESWRKLMTLPAQQAASANASTTP